MVGATALFALQVPSAFQVSGSLHKTNFTRNCVSWHCFKVLHFIVYCGDPEIFQRWRAVSWTKLLCDRDGQSHQKKTKIPISLRKGYDSTLVVIVCLNLVIC